MRTILIALLVLQGAPLAARSEEAFLSEASAVLHALKDRLLLKYRDNGNRVDKSWKVSDLAKPDELRGSYFEASEYSLRFENGDPEIAYIQFTSKHKPYPRDWFVRVHLGTGESEFSYVGETWWSRNEDTTIWGGIWVGLSLTAVGTATWLITRNKWFSLRAPKERANALALNDSSR